MEIVFKDSHILVLRDVDDKAYYGIQNAAGESALLYAIKQHLNKQGYSLIKKRMHKDGHLVSEMQQYLRTCKPTGDPNKDIYIYNGSWQIEGAEQAYNQGSCQLELVKDIFAN